jgi:hypothetical protein
MIPPKVIRELIVKYATAVARDDSVLMNHAEGVLETGGYKFCGYVGAPILVDQENTVVAQITFNYTKNNTIRKVTPFTVSYPNETK